MSNSIHYSSLLLCILYLTVSASRVSSHNYGRGFFNKSSCLYAYTSGASFELRTADGDILRPKLNLNQLDYDEAKSKCTNENKPGKLVFSFDIDGKKIKSIAISMKISPAVSEGLWKISQANLTVTRADIDKRRTFQLKVNEMYASLEHSWSCSELVLKTVHKKKPSNETANFEPRARLTLNNFQVQPFEELKNTVFAPSFDCAVWFTLSGVMGFVLILFIAFVTIIGTIFLSKITTNDFKFSKEGILFTQAQIEANKRQ